MSAAGGRHVVLVHGSYHGPWCWERLVPHLEALGLRATLVELPISDPSAGAIAYADAIEAQVEWREPPILVGHSMAGLVIPIVATRRSVRQLVFVAAALPRIGTSFNEQRAHEPIDGPPPTTAEWTDLGDGVWMVGPTTAREVFYDDATPEDAAWAISHLRPQAYLAMGERTPLLSWPLVPMAAIWCRADRAFSPAWVRRAARSRLGVEPVAIDGGHSPFITRPAELARVLESVFV